MVERGRRIGTRRARPRSVITHETADAAPRPRIWIVEDEPAAATLAAELCEQSGAEAVLFREPLPYLAALRGDERPSAVILDWRLEHELSAALFMATRHRHPDLRVVYWTGSPVELLPAMIRADGATRLVDKAAGTSAFESALEWAVAADPAARG